MSDESSAKAVSKYAWRELASRGLPKRSATERAADFLEIYGLYDEAAAREQAARCIQCPNPTCVQGCPLCNPIPQWMQLTAEGRFLEAAALLGSVTTMAEICVRLCPTDRLCEHSCILDSVKEPVSIRALEQFLAEYAFAHEQVHPSTPPPNGKRVAVVGSGPAGLACAEELAKRGYTVEVYDSALVPGGLLVNGVPPFKLDQGILLRRLELLRQRGVSFRLGVQLWERLSLTELEREHDAVFLGFDWRKARPFEVPGADAKGVVPALPFLLQKNTPVPLDLPKIEVAGNAVAVVGCGDTALDCLRTAVRYGAKEAIGVYRRSESEMPCSREDYQSALEEGVRFLFQAQPVQVLTAPDGSVSGLKLLHTELREPEPSGRRSFAPLPGTEFQLPAGLVIPALGFEVMPCPKGSDFERLSVNAIGALEVDSTLMTNVPGVFAGGDLVRGPSTVLHAVRDGRQAAEHIHRYLSRT